MKKYLQMSSAALMIGTFRVNPEDEVNITFTVLLKFIKRSVVARIFFHSSFCFEQP